MNQFTLEDLSSRDWRTRQQAISQLSLLDDSYLDQLAGHLVTLVQERRDDLGSLNASLQLLGKMGDAVLERLEPLLSDSESEVRIAAAVLLGRLPSSGSVDFLLRQLEDEDTNVQAHAAEGLGMQCAVTAVPALLEFIKKSEFFMAFAAVEAVGNIGSPAAAVELIDHLSDPLLGSVSAEALGKLGHVVAIPALVNALDESPEPEPYLEAIDQIAQHYVQNRAQESTLAALTNLHVSDDALASLVALAATTPKKPGPLARFLVWQAPKMGAALSPTLLALLDRPEARQYMASFLDRLGDAGPPTLQAALQNDDPDVRVMAAEVLAEQNDENAIPILCGLMDVEDGEVSTRAAHALGILGGEEAVNALLAHLDHPQSSTREACVQELLRLRPSTPILLPHVEHPDPAARAAAIELIGQNRELGAAEKLHRLLEHESDERVRCEIIEAVAPHVHNLPELHNSLEDFLKSDRASESATVARVLHRLPAFLIERLLPIAFASGELWTLINVCRSLSRITPASTVSELEKLLKDERPQVRSEAVKALAKVKRHNALPAILPLLEDDEPEVLLAAISALGTARAKEAVPQLTKLSESQHLAVRQAALGALSACGGPEVLAVLQKNLIDPRVSSSAAEAMSASADPKALTALLGMLDKVNTLRSTIIDELCHSDRDLTDDLAALLRTNASLAVRIAVVELLRRQASGQEADELLLHMLEDENPWIRRLVLLALSDRCYEDGLPQKVHELAQDDDDTGVRRTAMLVLAL